MNPELAGFEAECTPKSPLPRGRLLAVLLNLDRVMHGATAYQAGKNADVRDRDDVRYKREKQFGIVDDLERVCRELAKEFHISGIEAEKIPGALAAPGWVLNEFTQYISYRIGVAV